ncbi:MAG: MetQ/NlpA family ABC transporter substrate-binding protein [Clostridiales bacterium]|nr:MetQ/NlpA family ABC transporter substrate-binding protein [Clostridiales bacterium]MDY0119741.1 MetQ/NlpA family ABC transporter substrate-binding protein [Clostridia bacterium]
MKKKQVLSLGLAILLSVAFLLTSGCSKKKDDNKIVIGVSPAPHADIVAQVVEELQEQGITVDIREYSDYKTPNIALSDREIDANYFQHIPYFAEENSVGKFGLEILGGIHIEPIALFSTKHASLADLPDGAEIMLPNDTTNEGRALMLLEQVGLIVLKEGTQGNIATPSDIGQNPKNLKFTELEAATIPEAYRDADAAIINGNYAIEHGLNAITDSIAIEDSSSPYVNVIAVKEGDANRESLQKLLKALQSDKVKKFIEEKYEGGVVPAFQSKEVADKLAEEYTP